MTTCIPVLPIIAQVAEPLGALLAPAMPGPAHAAAPLVALSTIAWVATEIVRAERGRAASVIARLQGARHETLWLLLPAVVLGLFALAGG